MINEQILSKNNFKDNFKDNFKNKLKYSIIALGILGSSNLFAGGMSISTSLLTSAPVIGVSNPIIISSLAETASANITAANDIYIKTTDNNLFFDSSINNLSITQSPASGIVINGTTIDSTSTAITIPVDSYFSDASCLITVINSNLARCLKLDVTNSATASNIADLNINGLKVIATSTSLLSNTLDVVSGFNSATSTSSTLTPTTPPVATSVTFSNPSAKNLIISQNGQSNVGNVGTVSSIVLNDLILPLPLETGDTIVLTFPENIDISNISTSSLAFTATPSGQTLTLTAAVTIPTTTPLNIILDNVKLKWAANANTATLQIFKAAQAITDLITGITITDIVANPITNITITPTNNIPEQVNTTFKIGYNDINEVPATGKIEVTFPVGYVLDTTTALSNTDVVITNNTTNTISSADYSVTTRKNPTTNADILVINILTNNLLSGAKEITINSKVKNPLTVPSGKFEIQTLTPSITINSNSMERLISSTFSNVNIGNNLTFGNADATKSIISTYINTIPINASTVVGIQLKDINNNNLMNATCPTYTLTSSGPCTINGTTFDPMYGKIYGILTNNAAGTCIISGSINGTPITSTATINVINPTTNFKKVTVNKTSTGTNYTQPDTITLNFPLLIDTTTDLSPTNFLSTVHLSPISNVTLGTVTTTDNGNADNPNGTSIAITLGASTDIKPGTTITIPKEKIMSRAGVHPEADVVFTFPIKIDNLNAGKWNMISIPNDLDYSFSVNLKDMYNINYGNDFLPSLWAFKTDALNANNVYYHPDDTAGNEITWSNGLWIKPITTSVLIPGKINTTSGRAFTGTAADFTTYLKSNYFSIPNKWYLTGVPIASTWSDLYGSAGTTNTSSPTCNSVSIWYFNASSIDNPWNNISAIPANSAMWFKHNCDVNVAPY